MNFLKRLAGALLNGGVYAGLSLALSGFGELVVPGPAGQAPGMTHAASSKAPRQKKARSAKPEDGKPGDSARERGDQARDPDTGEGVEPLLQRERWFQLHRQGADGRIPSNARNEALRQLDENLRNRSLGPSPLGLSPHSLLRAGTPGKGPVTQTIPGSIWTPLGPAPLTVGSTSWTGRMTALAINPTNPLVVYAGAAQGGVWKTADGGSTWTPLTDSQPSLAIGSLAIDPSNPNTIYAGTGESNSSCDSYFGAGILKSMDGGSTWSVIGAVPFASASVSRIVVDPTNSNTLYATSSGGVAGFVGSTCYSGSATFGVYKSTNGGVSWSLVLGQTQIGINAETHELVMMPGSPQTLFAGVDQSGIWKTTNGGTSWSKLAGGLPTSTLGRIQIAVSPANPNNLFTVIHNDASGGLKGVYKTNNGGTSWTAVTIPPFACSNYCWYCLHIAIAPDGAVWIGGVDLFRSTNLGSSWTDVTNSNMHVDQHAVVFTPAGGAYAANDGGIFFSSDNGATWASRNAGLATMQFYNGASLHPVNANMALGGLQDNGTALFTGTSTWAELTGGDGAYTAFDSSNPDNIWYTSFQYLVIQKTTNAGGSFSNSTSGLLDAGSGASAFIAPFLVCPSNPTILIAGSDNVWRSTNSAGNWTSNSPDPLVAGSQITALAFAPSDASCGTYYAGTLNGNVSRTAIGGGTSGWANITGTIPQGRAVSDIAVDPTDANVVYVALSGFGGGHLYKSSNGLSPSPTWTQVDNGFPDSPLMAVLVDPTDHQVVYAGGDVGMFRSIDGGLSWQLFMDGLPNAAVYDIVAKAATQFIVAFTHGRGAWKLALPPANPKEASPAADMTAARGSGSTVLVNYSPACAAIDHAIYWGTGPIPGSVQWTNAACALGVGGSAAFNPGTPAPGGFIYFVIVGQTASREGSYGPGLLGLERPEAVGVGSCDRPQDLAGVCP